MAKCDRFENLLWDAAESGEMPEALERHLPRCAACRQALSQAQAALHGLQTLRAHPGETFLPPQPCPVLFPWRRLAVGAAAAAVLCALLLGGGFFHARPLGPTNRIARPLPAPPPPRHIVVPPQPAPLPDEVAPTPERPRVRRLAPRRQTPPVHVDEHPQPQEPAPAPPQKDPVQLATKAALDAPCVQEMVFAPPQPEEPRRPLARIDDPTYWTADDPARTRSASTDPQQTPDGTPFFED